MIQIVVDVVILEVYNMGGTYCNACDMNINNQPMKKQIKDDETIARRKSIQKCMCKCN